MTVANTLPRSAVAALALTGLLAGGLTAAPASAASATVCTGVSGCKIVASSDIDGDKRADQVGIVYKRDTSNSDGRWLITVRVKTATRTMQTTGRDVDWFWRPLYAVAPIDGSAGNEIVVGDITGANTYWFRTVTYRNGQLVTLKPPATSEARPSRWGVESSYSAMYGYSRSVSSTGVVSLTEKGAELNYSGHGFTGKNVTYHWKTGKWVKVSSNTVHYSTSSAASTIAGWHIKRLPRWPS